MPLVSCPKCGSKIAEQIPSTGQFKVSYIEKGRKMGDVLFMLPASTACGKCFKSFSITEQLAKDLICDCTLGSSCYIARPYKAKKRLGCWISVHLPTIQRSVDCADALLVCRNAGCDVRMFIAEFNKSGRLLASIAEENAAWSEFDDRGMTIQGLDNPPQIVIDAMV